jgi:putative transposase
MEGISKIKVSALAKSLDAEVAGFRSRPLDGGSYPHLWLDALSVKAREDGRVISVATLDKLHLLTGQQ